MTFDVLQSRLNTQHTDILLKWNDTPTMRKVLKLLYAYNYNFVNLNNFDINKSCSDLKAEVYDYFYTWYHGNSTIVLHIFYNDITGKNDIQFTNISTIKTYPQYKNVKIHTIF